MPASQTIPTRSGTKSVNQYERALIGEFLRAIDAREPHVLGCVIWRGQRLKYAYSQVMASLSEQRACVIRDILRRIGLSDSSPFPFARVLMWMAAGEYARAEPKERVA